MVALWTEIVNPAELTAFSRVAMEVMDDSLLTRILPNVNQDEVKFSWRVGSTVGGEAEYGEFDAEAPIGDTGGGEEKTIRLLPVSRKLKLSEYEQVTEPARVQQLAEDRADELVKQVIRRLNRARAEALVSGKLVLNENGIKQTANFGRKSAHTDAAPTALWSTATDPIQDLRRWADMVADESGAPVDTIAGSTRVATALGAKLAAAGYVSGGGTVVSRGVIDDVLASHGLPPFTVYDGRAGGSRFLPDDRVIMAVAGEAGGTVFAPTVESADPRFNLGDSGAGRSGIVAGLYKGEDPPIGWVLAKAIALPILANPNATLSAKVF